MFSSETKYLNFLLTLVCIPALVVLGETNSFGYNWPIAYLNEQHSVTSVLDECRGNRNHFHDGIDISDADDGTTVYAVRPGLAYQCGFGDNTGICVRGVAQDTFWYIHLKNRVPDDYYCYEGDSVGVTKAIAVDPSGHLHFAEGQNHHEINPLRFGGIYPFSDSADPIFEWTWPEYYINETPEQLFWNEIGGHVDIVIQVRDSITLGGDRAGIYRIRYEIVEYDWPYTIVYEGDHLRFDYWLDSTCINYVYHEGSGTSDFEYIITNKMCSDSFFDASAVEPYEFYRVRIIAYDIRGSGMKAGGCDTLEDQIYVIPVGIDSSAGIMIHQPDGVNDYADSSYTIEWSAWTADYEPDPSVARVSLWYDTNRYDYDGVLIETDLLLSGTYDWNTSDMSEGDYFVYGKLEYVDYGAQAYSRGPVTIDRVSPTVQVLSPNGGETRYIGYTYNIEWIADDNIDVDYLDIYYSIYDPDNLPYPPPEELWDSVSFNEPNDSVYSWTIPNNPSPNCRVKIIAYDVVGNSSADTSDNFFTIKKKPSPPCPFLYTWNGSEYVEDNNILAASEIDSCEVTEYYKLEQPPVEEQNRTDVYFS